MNCKTPPKLLIVSHGKMCDMIVESAKMIGIDVSDIIPMPMEEVVNVDIFENDIRDIVDTFPSGSLVLVDLLGGTPFNIISRILMDYDLYAVTGVNLPMIIEFSTYCKTLSGKELQIAIKEAGKNGIIDINEFLNEL